MPMKDHDCWVLAEECLAMGVPITLLCVTESSNASPGRQGFKMVVAKDGRSVGTIGGGAMEYRFMGEAAQALSDGSRNPRLVRQNHSNTAPENRSGMICAGYQLNAVVPCYSDTLPTFRRLREAHLEARNGVLEISPAGIQFHPDRSPPKQYAFHSHSKEDWRYQEKIGAQSHAYIVGGGHVGYALSRVMRQLDFLVTVFDHRPGLQMVTENEFAHKTVIGPYKEIEQKIIPGYDSYVAVVSTTFKTDEEALKAVIGLELRYLGVMGSKAKIEHLFRELRRSGATDEQIERIHAPIGLDIKSRSVEEIAISIAAEIIEVKNRSTSNVLRLAAHQ